MPYDSLQSFNMLGLAISRGGQYLATPSETDGTIILWNVADKRQIKRLENSYVGTSVFSADGQSLVTVSNLARVWDTSSGMELYRIIDDKNLTGGGVLSPDGSLLATRNVEGTVKVWKLKDDPNPVHSLITPTLSDALRVSNDYHYLASMSSSDSSTVHVWDLNAGREVTTIKHQQEVEDTALSPDGEYLAVQTKGNSRTIWVWRRDDKSALAHWELPGEKPSRLAFSQGGKYLVISYRNGLIEIWEVNQSQGGGKKINALTIEGVDDIVALTNADLLLVESSKGAQFRHIPDGQPVGELMPGSLTRYALSGNGAYLAINEIGERVKVVEVATGKVVGVLPHAEGVNDLALSYDGELVATAGAGDHIMRVWTWKGQPRILNQVKYDVMDPSIAISADGKYISVTADEETPRVWDVTQPGKIREVARIRVEGGAGATLFSPNNKYLITFSSDSGLQMWQWQADQLVCQATERLIKKDLTSDEWQGYLLSSELRFLDPRQRPRANCGNVP
jgi:WD40 repeat protein